MVDGFEGEKGTVVAGSRGYFLKVRVGNQWGWDYKEVVFFFFKAESTESHKSTLMLTFLL